MRTVEDFDAMTLEERSREWAQLTDAAKTLYGYYELSKDGKPSTTVKAFVDEVGRDEASKVIATLVNNATYFGHISPAAAHWASSVPAAWDKKATLELEVDIFSDIPPVHLNQIARVMMGGCKSCRYSAVTV
nr:MAG TPA: hypothetical protein [Caudoviricetes sp.]